MDVLGWVVLIVGAVVIVFIYDLLLKRFLGGERRVLPHEAPEVQAQQQAARSQGSGGGYGPLG